MTQEYKPHHVLKISDEFYNDVVFGFKTFEIRRTDDRTFKEGEIIKLIEVDQNKACTGFSVLVRITYVLEQYPGIEKGYALLSIKTLQSKGQGLIPIRMSNV